MPCRASAGDAGPLYCNCVVRGIGRWTNVKAPATCSSSNFNGISILRRNSLRHHRPSLLQASYGDLLRTKHLSAGCFVQHLCAALFTQGRRLCEGALTGFLVLRVSLKQQLSLDAVILTDSSRRIFFTAPRPAGRLSTFGAVLHSDPEIEAELILSP